MLVKMVTFAASLLTNISKNIFDIITFFSISEIMRYHIVICKIQNKFEFNN